MTAKISTPFVSHPAPGAPKGSAPNLLPGGPRRYSAGRGGAGRLIVASSALLLMIGGGAQASLAQPLADASQAPARGARPPGPAPTDATPAPSPDPPPAAEEFRNPPDAAERHPSGLVSLKLAAGDGQDPPDSNDIVQVHFTAWDREGRLFRTSREGGKPATMTLSNVFAGWSEGIQKMVSGERRRLWVPSHLGPQNAKSGPSSAVFDVELMGIVRVPNPPKPLNNPHPSATPLDNGIHSHVLQRGQGLVKPDPDGRILAHYIVWTSDGQVLDSSFVRARPTAFILDNMMPALSEVLQDMTLGERRQLWVPEGVHQGNWPGAPKGQLVFDIQLFYFLPKEALQPKGDGAPAASGGRPGGGDERRP